MRNNTNFNKNSWLFYPLAFGWSWLFLVPAAVIGLKADQVLTSWLRALAGIGPLLSALVLLYFQSSPESRADYWVRLISFKRIKGLWWLITLFTPLVLTLVAGALDSLVGGTGLQLESGLPEIANPLAWLGFAGFILVFGPVPEEMGWRGMALDGLQNRWGALSSSVVLGLAWALWHLPLFFIEGTYQAELGLFTVDFYLFLLMMIPMSVLITWIYTNNSRSTLSAILFHFAINLTGEVFLISRSGNWIYFGLWILAAGLVIWRTDPGTFQNVWRSVNLEKGNQRGEK